MNDCEYASYYELSYAKSIAISHREYLNERCSNRKLLIYGAGETAVSLRRYLSLNGINTEAFIDDAMSGQRIDETVVISTIDLVYFDQGSYFVILASDDENYGISRQKFLEVGLQEDLDFTYHTEIPGTNELFHYDVTLSFSRIRQKIPGFEVFGDESNIDAFRIVALGGSTTECSLFYVKGWVQYLYEYLRSRKIPVVIYGGGVSSYTSSQELLKLIRDVIPLKPDIVISYSGVNDLYSYPKQDEEERYQRPFITRFQVQFINQIIDRLTKEVGIPVVNAPSWNQLGHNTVFYGLRNEKTAAEFWVDNERMMYAICEMFGINFFGIYQPYRFNGCYKSTSLQEIIHHRRDLTCVPTVEGERRWGASVRKDHKRIVSEIKKYKYLYDFSEIFDDQTEVFYDTTHVYEKGNQIIATNILNRIESVLISKKPKKNGLVLKYNYVPLIDKTITGVTHENQIKGIDYYRNCVLSIAESNCLPKDKVMFGGYTWVVLYSNKDYSLVLSELPITVRDYHDTLVSTTWEECELRKWLNGEFLQQFNDEERKKILPAITQNHNNPQFQTDGGKTTTDYVFLLSYDDVTTFIKESELCESPLQASSWWWLRSPGIYSDRAMAVHVDGHIVIPGYYIKSYSLANGAGVRPAMLLKI